MNVKRYFAATAREALRALKAELGADAIVLSNRAVEGGVEILALPADEVGAVSTPPRRESAPVTAVSEHEDEDCRVSLGSTRPQPQPAAKPAPQIRAFEPPRMETPDYIIRKRGYEDVAQVQAPVPRPAAPRPAPQAERPAAVERVEPVLREELAPMAETVSRHLGEPARTSAEDPRIAELQQANARLMSELGGIRGMIERQLAAFAWGDTRRNAPGRAEVLGELLDAGFPTRLARKLVESVDEAHSADEARTVVRNTLGRDLRAMSSDADLIDRGGVFALVGPTGVGKTTTTAKIAARCVMRHGADKIALITTDGYRIGAQEQLRIYGRILGVPVFPVRDASDLRQTIAELRGKHMILIDTVGMSQRDEMVVKQAAMLSGAGNVHRLLLLNATASGETLDDVIDAWKGPDLAGCVLTKVDEAVSLAPAVGAAISNGLEVFYVTNGQRVPEDLHLPNRAYLLHRSLNARVRDAAWKLDADEAAMKFAAGAGA
ncbi:MAG: flagellar biosynthesis protein FlhF [Pseudazoarcus pumilus]|nr:flagellar biosynthesis protein FlhF [Pseudazoarcus pumilus]